MDENEGCFIAKWTSGGHVDVARGYDTSTVDGIMLRYRPIAPKPTSVKSLEGGSNINPSDGRHAKSTVRSRKKGSYKKNNNSLSSSIRSCNHERKRKSSSPPDQSAETIHQQKYNRQVQKGGVTLLPLFPETPDLSPTKQEASKMPIWLNYV